MDTVQYSNVLYFKALGLMTCHTAVGIMNLRKNHSLKNLGACSVLDFPPGHEQCGDHRLHILKQGDNLVWQWDGKCEVSGWFLLQPISRVCLFPDMDAKYTIPELQRGKRVYREKMPCIMGDGAMGWVQTAGGGGRGGGKKETLSAWREGLWEDPWLRWDPSEHGMQQSTEAGSCQPQLYGVGLGHSGV